MAGSFSNLKKTVYNAIKKFFVVTVADKSGGAVFAIVGAAVPSARYKHLYIGRENEVSISRQINFSGKKAINTLLNKYGMLVIRDEAMLNGIESQGLLNPNFLDTSIYLPVDYDSFYSSLGSSAREDIRKVKKKGFNCSFSSDPNWCAVFFHEYYAPSMRDRHADDAYVMDEGGIREIIARPGGEFARIYVDDKCVAAALAIAEGKKYSFLRIGWAQSVPANIQASSLSAVYWFIIQRGFELNCNEINLGGTPPQLESGVLKYKAKWQAQLSSGIFYGLNYLLFDPANRFCYQFLNSNSILVLNHKKQLLLLANKSTGGINGYGRMLQEMHSSYVLLESKAEKPTANTEGLPDYLRYWYERANTTTEKGETES